MIDIEMANGEGMHFANLRKREVIKIVQGAGFICIYSIFSPCEFNYFQFRSGVVCEIFCFLCGCVLWSSTYLVLDLACRFSLLE